MHLHQIMQLHQNDFHISLHDHGHLNVVVVVREQPQFVVVVVADIVVEGSNL